MIDLHAEDIVTLVHALIHRDIHWSRGEASQLVCVILQYSARITIERCNIIIILGIMFRIELIDTVPL